MEWKRAESAGDEQKKAGAPRIVVVGSFNSDVVM